MISDMVQINNFLVNTLHNPIWLFSNNNSWYLGITLIHNDYLAPHFRQILAPFGLHGPRFGPGSNLFCFGSKLSTKCWTANLTIAEPLQTEPLLDRTVVQFAVQNRTTATLPPIRSSLSTNVKCLILFMYGVVWDLETLAAKLLHFLSDSLANFFCSKYHQPYIFYLIPVEIAWLNSEIQFLQGEVLTKFELMCNQCLYLHCNAAACTSFNISIYRP